MNQNKNYGSGYGSGYDYGSLPPFAALPEAHPG